MKLISLISLCGIATLTKAKELFGFREVYGALTEGFNVRFSIDYETCVPSLGPASSRGEIGAWEYFGLADSNIPELLRWSQTATITNYQGHGFALDYVRMAIYANDSLTLFASDINPTEYSPIYEETSVCPLSTQPGTVKSVRFFTSATEADVKQLTTFEDISNALQSQDLKVVNNYGSCPSYNGPFNKLGLNIKSGGSLVTTEIFSGGRFTTQPFLAFSEESF